MQKQSAVTPEQAVTSRRSESEQQLTVMIQRLEQELAGLGLVNPNAIDEYERLCERHQFLHQQVTDLIEAKEYLSAIIKDIDASISKQFIEAFKKINTYFAEIFARLFGGGQARLQLGDPNNLLDSGIEIIVQPPGKKLQNLVLLSGGERALTVIALLFAFLSYRPAPFSVVDEIDAPLDEANLERFSNFLRDYSQKTQFIVVTHRKGTMEAADVLHGVTLEEAGVSRIVSVKLADKVS
jgi:chromosome segregation protein